MKNVPVLYERKEDCCGCSACQSKCPANAIRMEPDSEGFRYPVIDIESCIRCHQCVTACEFHKEKIGSTDGVSAEPEANAVKHSNPDIQLASQSGGIFTAVSDYILSEGGIVYGCVLNEDQYAVHTRAESAEDRNKMRGSKYVQSNLQGVFQQLKSDLENGKLVLFTGTSCEVAGLRGYLRKDYERLICMDIICHGVPSPKVWADYVAWREKQMGSKCTDANFRNKMRYGRTSHVETLEFSNGEELDSQVFKELFYTNRILRPSCYECPFKTVSHPGDITFGDFWGIQKAAPEFFDTHGVSLVLLNNEKATAVFDAVKDSVIYKKVPLADSLQPMLLHPSPRPKNRPQFWKDYETKSFEKVAVKWGYYGPVGSIRKKVKKTLIKIRKFFWK